MTAFMKLGHKMPGLEPLANILSKLSPTISFSFLGF